MNRIWPWLAGLVLLLVIGGAYLISVTPFKADQEKAVRRVIEGFGQQLKEVSLSASREDVASAMQASYAPYVVPGLLTRWENDPMNAPGRLTSSPWPERIEIRSITEESDTRYAVEGDIVEVTSEAGGIGEQPSEAVRRPVSMTVEKNGSWRITGLILHAYPGDGDWVYSEPDARGIQFKYPKTLPTTYISTSQEGWPPQVTLAAGEYSCAKQDEHIVGDRALCVVKTSEGAAGSTYTTYEYIASQGDPIRELLASNGAGFLARVKFTLRFPQCMNYDEPQQSACTAEQGSFDIDGLADRILSSIRMQ